MLAFPLTVTLLFGVQCTPLGLLTCSLCFIKRSIGGEGEDGCNSQHTEVIASRLSRLILSWTPRNSRGGETDQFWWQAMSSWLISPSFGLISFRHYVS
ncbi:hypothetical protein EI94DRAFT_1725105 [Lactarius quietus]|nr:hypothetical protein EI94DRAFT_1725105 [Lactarius quietus]